MSDEPRSFISFTPVVDVSFLDPQTIAFLNCGERETLKYIEWDTGWILPDFPEPSRTLNAALISKGVPAHSNCILKMY